jgi:hypothetical protein
MSFKVNPTALGLANYCGPGTKLEGQPCKSKSDCACKKHDYDFQNIREKMKDKEIDKKEAKELVRNADNDLLNSLSEIKETSLSDKFVNNISYAGIRIKTKLEDYSLLDPLTFV